MFANREKLRFYIGVDTLLPEVLFYKILGVCAFFVGRGCVIYSRRREWQGRRRRISIVNARLLLCDFAGGYIRLTRLPVG